MSTISLAIAWSVGIGLVGYLWAKRLFNRDGVHVERRAGVNLMKPG